jgi:hypothetical protein
VRDARARGARDDGPAPYGVALGRLRPVCVELELTVALEHDEDLLLGGMAVRRRVQLAGGDLADPQA